MTWNRPILRLGVLALPLLAGGCQAARDMDAAMRSVGVLDRVFEPDRYGAARTRAAAAPAAATVPAEAVPRPAVTAEPLPPVLAGPGSEPAAPQVKDPLAGSDAMPAAQPVPDPPRADPAVRRATLLRENPWVARFWSELDAAQRGRVQRALARAGQAGPDAAARWDPMGLGDRVRLVFGDEA